MHINSQFADKCLNSMFKTVLFQLKFSYEKLHKVKNKVEIPGPLARTSLEHFAFAFKTS